MLEDSPNDEVFEVYAKINYSLNYTMTDYNSNKVKEELLKKIRKDEKRKKFFKYKNYLKYAAILIIALSVSFYTYNVLNLKKPTNEIVNVDEHKSDEIILKLDNGETRIIKSNQNNTLKNSLGLVYGVQKKETLQYDSTNVVNELVYNELIIPYGKRFNLVLSDGTKIELNAGSYIKYPVQFIEGLSRKVFLKGEAYFDVAHNDNDKFIVNADNLDIEVLGTEFNVSFYPEDDKIETVLVEGSVLINNTNIENNKFLLKPGHIASYNREFGEMAIIKMDTTFYTAWRYGAVGFKSKSFKDILKKLERHFDQELVNYYKYLDEQIYTASFYDGETLEEILSYFNEETQFKYIKNNNQIIITNPLTN